MKIEHFAFNVEEPIAMVDWYVKNLGMKVIKQSKELPFTAFLADDGGKVMIEVYKNSTAPIPDYKEMNPLTMHLAFVSEEPNNDKNNLVKAGATVISNNHLEDGSHLVMLRDPWGICIQLCKRAKAMIVE